MPRTASSTVGRERVDYAALDVSLEKTSLCILDHDSQIVLETVIASEPDAVAVCLDPYWRQLVRLGLEAGLLSEWLVRGLAWLPS